MSTFWKKKLYLKCIIDNNIDNHEQLYNTMESKVQNKYNNIPEIPTELKIIPTELKIIPNVSIMNLFINMKIYIYILKYCIMYL